MLWRELLETADAVGVDNADHAMTPTLKNQEEELHVYCIAHGGAFCPSNPRPHRPPPGSLHSPARDDSAPSPDGALTRCEQAGAFQGGRFVLCADAGPVCASCTKRGAQMDFPSFPALLSRTLAAWGLPQNLLDTLDPAIRPMFWSSLLKASEVSTAPSQRRGVPPVSSPAGAEGVPSASSRPGAEGVPPVSSPAGAGTATAQREPLPFIRRPAQPRSPQAPPRGLDVSDYLSDWHQKVRLALWVAAEALETLRATPNAEEYRLLLIEQCRKIGLWHAELQQWAGAFLAATILQGELRFLQHRASAVVTSLLFAA
jgi:hypothetical protein